MKCGYKKHLWEIIVIELINKEISRYVVRLTTTKNVILGGTYLLRDEEV